MKYDFKVVEDASHAFWKSNDIYNKVKMAKKDGKPFYFLQGPPYTSGNIHIGHAWNAALKDMALRYKRMKGFNVWDRWGYDMHGLPTENKVQKKLGLKSKEDIIAYGLEKFQKECFDFSMETAKTMNEDFTNLGLWVDYENAYMPITPEFISGEWALIKKAHEKNRLYKGKKVMTWDAETETAHAKHELEYETVTDTSTYVKFKVADKENEYLLIWTTAAWSVPFNMAVMANPKKEYVRVKADNEVWIIAKDLVESLAEISKKELEIVETFPGKDLEGLKYTHPLRDKILAFGDMSYEYLHTVILSEQHVETTSGTGLVSCAPGCGPEDYDVGMSYGLKPFNEVNEQGLFENMGEYNGLEAKADDDKFIEFIDAAGALLAKRKVKHEYPHSWRSHKPIIFRTTEQWFMKVEDLRDDLLAQNKGVNWNPNVINNTFESWISNLRDNAITRQRFWGCPVPIWEDEDGNVEVIGSLEELKKRAITPVPEDLHIPYIDSVKLLSSSGKEMTRVPDVLDVWIDSGTVSWNSLNYQQNEDGFDQLFPADLIIEGADQARLWFTMLQICSKIMFDETAYKNVYSHGMILDFDGAKMSKSLGNVISPNEVIKKVGADVFRYYVCESIPGRNINFTWDELTLKQRNINVLWNMHNYLLDLHKTIPSGEASERGVEELYILSRLHSTIKAVSGAYEAYQFDKTIGLIEGFFLDLSRTYIQLIRDKATSGSDGDKILVYDTLRKSMDGILRMLSTICPMTCEQMYQNLQEVYAADEESIHMLPWPSADESLIDVELEREMDVFGSVIQSGLAGREEAKLGLRWPLKEIIIESSDPSVIGMVERLDVILRKQLNVKNIALVDALEGVSYDVKVNHKTLGKKYGKNLPGIIKNLSAGEPHELYANIVGAGSLTINVDGTEFVLEKEDLIFGKKVPEHLKGSSFSLGSVYVDSTRTPELDLEGYAREVMRRVQQLRKDDSLERADRIKLHVKTDLEGFDLYSEHIKDKCGVSEFVIGTGDSSFMPKDTFTVKGKEFGISYDIVQ